MPSYLKRSIFSPFVSNPLELEASECLIEGPTLCSSLTDFGSLVSFSMDKVRAVICC